VRWEPLDHLVAVRGQPWRVGSSDRLEDNGADEDERPRRTEDGLRPVQKEPGTEVISFPLSVQPQSAVLHVTAVAGGAVMRPVTSVSKTQPPASTSDVLPSVEPLEDPLDEPPDEPLEPSGKPLSSIAGGLLLLLLPHPVATRPVIPTVIIAASSASEPPVKGLMCRFRSRPGWAS
jgi:hypothetical protein